MAITPDYQMFRSTNHTHDIVTTMWIPDTPPVGVVQIVHGMREHMGRYQDFADFLLTYGFVVVGHDHIGHGKTAKHNGTFGFFGEANGARILVQDSCKLTNILVAKYPHLPLFLLGHSMGSMVARLQCLTVAQSLSGFICMGTAGSNHAAPLARAMVEGACNIEGGMAHSRIIQTLMDRMTSSLLSKNEPPDAWISHNPATVARFMQDPLTHFTFSNRAYADLLDLMIACNEPEWYKRISPTLPILLVSGSEDPIGAQGKGVMQVLTSLKNITNSQEASCHIYDHMRHEILNEIGYDEVYSDLLDWMIFQY